MVRVCGWAVTICLATGVAMAGDASALADAAMNGDVRAMRALLKSGADVDAPGAFGTPALHWRVRVDDVAGAALLLKAGAHVDVA